jgi:hypothetical protein
VSGMMIAHRLTPCRDRLSTNRLADPGPLAEDMDMTSDVTVAPSKPAGH